MSTITVKVPGIHDIKADTRGRSRFGIKVGGTSYRVEVTNKTVNFYTRYTNFFSGTEREVKVDLNDVGDPQVNDIAQFLATPTGIQLMGEALYQVKTSKAPF